MSDDLKKQLLEFVQAAVDLANNIQHDISYEGEISYSSILQLSEFRRKHDELETILDILNGVN